jgi:hypothetical protein
MRSSGAIGRSSSAEPPLAPGAVACAVPIMESRVIKAARCSLLQPGCHRELGQHHEGLVIATPSRSPLTALREVRPGTHVTAIGGRCPREARARPAVTRGARVAADDPSQAARVGECQSPSRPGSGGRSAVFINGVALRCSLSSTLLPESAIIGSSGIRLDLCKVLEAASGPDRRPPGHPGRRGRPAAPGSHRGRGPLR